MHGAKIAKYYSGLWIFGPIVLPALSGHFYSALVPLSCYQVLFHTIIIQLALYQDEVTAWKQTLLSQSEVFFSVMMTLYLRPRRRTHWLRFRYFKAQLFHLSLWSRKSNMGFKRPKSCFPFSHPCRTWPDPLAWRGSGGTDRTHHHLPTESGRGKFNC